MSRGPTHELTPTEEQKTILSMADKGGDLVIMALAGTGKATTVGLVAKSLGSRSKKGLYLTYNSEIKRTVVEKESRSFCPFAFLFPQTSDAPSGAQAPGPQSSREYASRTSEAHRAQESPSAAGRRQAE